MLASLFPILNVRGVKGRTIIQEVTDASTEAVVRLDAAVYVKAGD